MDRPIGIFDSGVGGLTVLESLKNELPNENLIYIGDNKHCPYGDKTKEQLLEYAIEICDYFEKQNVKMIVLACNTTSANVLDELQVRYPHIPIVGVIHSTVHEFLIRDKNNVLIIATNATINAHKYKDLILQYDPSKTVFELATPLLVPLIESGEYINGIKKTLKQYLDSYINQIDSIILGCTHYPIITNQIKEVLGEDKEYISSSKAICYEVSSYLTLHKQLNEGKGNVIIYTTGDVKEFIKASELFYNYKDQKVHQLVLK